MHFDVVLSEFIHPCTKKQRRAQYSRGVDAHASDVCVCALQMCACASDVCVRACLHFRCVRWKLLTQHSTVTPTIPSIIYARLVPSGSPYMESVRLNENARVGGNA